MNRRSLIALIGIAWFVGTSSADASCVDGADFVAPYPGTPYLAYLQNPVCDTSTCGIPGASPNFNAFFWKLGSGDPRTAYGDDSGSTPWWNFVRYGPLSYYYGLRIDGDWNDAGVDGCFTDGSAPPSGACMAVVVHDHETTTSPSGRTAVAVATAADPGFLQTVEFPTSTLLMPMTELPVPPTWYDSLDGENTPYGYATVGPPGLTGYLDPACEDPVRGYRIYVRRDGQIDPVVASGWSLPAAGGTLPDGSPIPFGTTTRAVFGCDHVQSIGHLTLMGYTLVFESGFELPVVQRFGPSNENRWPGTPCCEDADADENCVEQSSLDGLPGPDCDDTNPTVLAAAEQRCGDGLNNDCLHPSWPALDGTNEFDDDLDGLTECDGDCDDSDPAISDEGPPAEVSNLVFADKTTLTWDPPAVGTTELYRGVWIEGAGPTTQFCPIGEENGGSMTVGTPPGAGQIFAYLARGKNACGDGPMGSGSAGPWSPGAQCP